MLSILKTYTDGARQLRSSSLFSWLHEQLYVKKLNSPLGYVLLFSICLGLSYFIVFKGTAFGLAALGAILGIPCLLVSLFNLRFGVSLIVIISFFLLGVKRVSNGVPMGLALDILISVMFFGLFIKQVREKDWSFAKNPVSYMVLIWIVYNIIEVANPWASSRIAWFFAVRSIAGLMILYYVILYAINSKEFVTWLIKLWIILASLAAFYCLYQEFFGLLPFEMEWLMSDPERYHLIYQWGRFRKFSFLSDPTSFGILMAYTSLFCLVIMYGPVSLFKKIILVAVSGAMMMAMVYSGTRTAFVLIPVGVVFYALLTFNRYVLVFAGFMVMVALAIMFVPTSNPHIYRMQSAFRIDKNDSYATRVRNQAFIQPYIQSHPMGGGLGSAGVWGKRFSPNSLLANFPPDSGYVRIAVELGWIGLFIYCTLLFVTMKVGIKNYFLTKDPLLKTYYAAFLTLLYVLIVANFPQEAIPQVPTNLMFYVSLAVIVKLKDFDTQTEKIAND